MLIEIEIHKMSGEYDVVRICSDDESSEEAYVMSVGPKTTRKIPRLTCIIDSELLIVIVVGGETKQINKPSDPKRYMPYGHETETIEPDSFNDGACGARNTQRDVQH